MTTSHPTVSAAGAVWLVAEREVASKLRSKAFVISTSILLLIALAGVLIGGFAGPSADERSVAVTPETASVIADMPGVSSVEVADRPAAEELVREGDVDAALVTGGDAVFPYTVIAFDSASTTLLLQLAQLPPVELLQTQTTDPMLRMFVALGFGLVFLMAASTFGATMAQSVVEEKQTRVVELLLSAISPRQLLAGKVLGNTILAMSQILALAAIAVVGLTVTGQTLTLQGLGGAIAWFAVFFLFGFVLLAALYAAAAAMVSRMEDIGSTTMPLMMLVMAPYFLVIFFNDNPTVLTILSYVPFSAPVGMPMRLFVGEALWWEPLLSLVILMVSCLAAIAVGAKIYENSLLRMGARVRLIEALRG
ncbi:ABC transporter permease [Microbacterium sp. YY-01]|uniref:ABC transporter permease n=1 Tax=Microbacterium sp. YY-01 TaxID=3421634 RepID=UPI003D176A52